MTSNEPYFADNSPAMIELERMVDRVGMANVLYALARICWHKAEHLEMNWQNQGTAYLWRIGGNKLDKFAAQSNVAFHNSPDVA